MSRNYQAQLSLIDSGCNGVASTLGVLGSVARRYAHRIPFIVKLNHNEFLSFPNTYDQSMFAEVEQAFEMGAVAVGATIYFGSAESRRQIREVSLAFKRAHELHPENWTYKRQAWTFVTTPEGQPSDLLQGPNDVYDSNWLDEVRRQGAENYYDVFE